MPEATPPKVTPQAVASILAEAIVNNDDDAAVQGALWLVAMQLGIEAEVQGRIGDLHDR
jgi:hypothetical protein